MKQLLLTKVSLLSCTAVFVSICYWNKFNYRKLFLNKLVCLYHARFQSAQAKWLLNTATQKKKIDANFQYVVSLSAPQIARTFGTFNLIDQNKQELCFVSWGVEGCWLLVYSRTIPQMTEWTWRSHKTTCSLKPRRNLRPTKTLFFVRWKLQWID